MKEEGLANGLKYYFSDNSTAKEGYSELQAENYQNAEKLFYECFDKLNKNVLDSLENINIDNFNLVEDNFELFNELSANFQFSKRHNYCTPSFLAERVVQ